MDVSARFMLCCERTGNTAVEKKDHAGRRLWNAVLKLDPMHWYCIASIVCVIALLGCFLATRGELISHYFFYDTLDTGMDFFNSMEYVRGRVPYTVYGTLYPPLANLIFFALYLFVPVEYAERWPVNFSESVAIRGTSMDLRVHQASLLIFVVFFILSAIMLFALIDYALGKRGTGKAKLTALCMIVSYGCLMAVERGNISILAAGLGLVFVLFYDSDNKIFREIALLSLAFSAGIKLYPAVWGVMLLAEKDWKAAVRAVIYGVAALVLPMLAFEGFSAFSIFIGKTSSFGSSKALSWKGTGIAEIFNNISRAIAGVVGREAVGGTFTAAVLAGCLLLVASCFFLPKRWQRCFAATLCMVMFRSQGSYCLIMFVVPLTLFFREESQMNRKILLPFLGLMLLTVNIPAFSDRYAYDARNTITQIALAASALWCIYASVREIVIKRRGAACVQTQQSDQADC